MSVIACLRKSSCSVLNLWRRVLAVRKIAITIIVAQTLAISALGQEGKPAPQQTTSTDRSCRSFVQHFYNWYVPLALSDKVLRAWDVAVRNKPQTFTPQLAQLIRRDTEAQRKASEIVGLDFDPFLNSQDPSERFVVESVVMKGAGCWVKVRGISKRQAQETVVPEVACTNGRCQFVNFHYEYDGHPTDLLTILKTPG